jgi:hypothetical protein
MSLTHNERIKLLATALNNMAVATVITAVVGPFVGLLNGSQAAAVGAWWAFSGALWFLAGIALHLGAQMVLGRLRPSLPRNFIC